MRDDLGLKTLAPQPNLCLEDVLDESGVEKSTGYMSPLLRGGWLEIMSACAAG